MAAEVEEVREAIRYYVRVCVETVEAAGEREVVEIQVILGFLVDKLVVEAAEVKMVNFGLGEV